MLNHPGASNTGDEATGVPARALIGANLKIITQGSNVESKIRAIRTIIALLRRPVPAIEGSKDVIADYETWLEKFVELRALPEDPDEIYRLMKANWVPEADWRMCTTRTAKKIRKGYDRSLSGRLISALDQARFEEITDEIVDAATPKKGAPAA